MQCYVCAKAGKQTEAVGMCIVCGMGLCMDHALREDVDFWEGGYPFPSQQGQEEVAAHPLRGVQAGARLRAGLELSPALEDQVRTGQAVWPAAHPGGSMNRNRSNEVRR